MGSGSPVVQGGAFGIDPPIPGPQAAAWEQARLWIEDPLSFWESCQKQYGDLFRVELGSLGTIVLFCDPAAVKEVFALPASAFECHHYNQQYAYVMGKKSLLLDDGVSHAQQRKLIGSLISAQLADVQRLSKRFVHELVGEGFAGPEVAVRPWMHLIVFRIIMQLVFGSRRAELAQELCEHYRKDIVRDLGSWRPWQRFSKWQAELRVNFANEVKQVRSSAILESSALFDQLAMATDESGELLDCNQISDHLFTLFTAGVDPVAISLSWALHWIYHSDGVENKLRVEVERIASDDTVDVHDDAPYLQGVINETLRMYPVVTTPSGRRLTEPVYLAKRHFPAGVTLLPCTYLVHRREDLYPDPAQFNPDRFLRRRYLPSEYFPFGGGVRTCIGAMLAGQMLINLLVEILSSFRFRPLRSGQVAPVRHGTLLAPSDDLKFSIECI